MFVASFMGSAPINAFEVDVRPDRLEGHGIRLPVPPGRTDRVRGGDRVVVAARPEELSLLRAATPWSVAGTVTSVLPTGHTAFVRVDFADGDDHVTAEHDLRSGGVATGDRVHVAFDPDALHLFDAATQQRL